jgi:hypothetical protein
MSEPKPRFVVTRGSGPDAIAIYEGDNEVNAVHYYNHEVVNGAITVRLIENGDCIQRQYEARKLFLVVGYDDDQQQCFWDLVPAVSQTEAQERASRMRPYSVVTDCLTQKELEDVAANMRRTTLDEAEATCRQYEAAEERLAKDDDDDREADEVEP